MTCPAASLNALKHALTVTRYKTKLKHADSIAVGGRRGNLGPREGGGGEGGQLTRVQKLYKRYDLYSTTCTVPIVQHQQGTHSGRWNTRSILCQRGKGRVKPMLQPNAWARSLSSGSMHCLKHIQTLPPQPLHPQHRMQQKESSPRRSNNCT